MGRRGAGGRVNREVGKIVRGRRGIKYEVRESGRGYEKEVWVEGGREGERTGSLRPPDHCQRRAG